MARSNYDKWVKTHCDANGAMHREYVAPARGEPRRWVNRHGRTVEVLRAADEGLDGDGMPWLAVCTDHGNLLSVPTKADGVSACRDTTQFCDQCRADAKQTN
jgi:hypothetical protein